eukprot:gnl/MRDRNA2_/MRDRNA2_111524_c0_seq1.p1 gnl/MRDRNA2_/MRDRNA2_111524_c0~~gnl/MRDRNA2_/MRDRNA2_111524_c0_seq1.p1  ORF type:complete len:172 (+),score=38.98 gnl/MRDRNA2_/MRDRNA2_111524_c0_seq1:102-617(+)
MSLAIRTQPLICIALALFSLHSASAVRLPSASSAMGKADPLKHKQQRNYGVLGNVIAQLADRVFSPSATTFTTAAESQLEKDQKAKTVEKANTVTPIPHSGAQKAAFVSPLKGVKELLRLLWLNFLPDPTFDHAIKELKKRDRQFSIDNAEGAGIYITAAQKAKLLSYAAM